MWVVVMFDLPVKTKEQRHRATRFRKHLLEHGFSMMQYSVYMRPCSSEEAAGAHRDHVKAALPPLGRVRILLFTDKQFSRMWCFDGKQRTRTEGQPRQLEFF